MNFPHPSSLSALFVLCALLLLLPGGFGFVSAASVLEDEQQWRPILPSDLSLKEPRVEKDADAEAIFWEVRIDDSSSNDLALNHYVRVKIFTERGREKYSKIDVPFIKGKKVKNLAARVVKPDGSIVELRKEEIFEREIVKVGGLKVKAKSFAVPNIEPGVIVEYRYREIFDDAGAVGMRLDFQRDIPVQRLSYYYKPHNKNARPQYQVYNLKDVNFVEDQNGFYLATKTDVPSFKEEPQMPPADQVRPWMLLQAKRILKTSVSKFGYSFALKDPADQQLYWSAVSQEKGGYAKFMNLPEPAVKNEAIKITGAVNGEDKLRKLYDFCQTQIRNISADLTLTDEQRKNFVLNKTKSEVLTRRAGTSLDVDLLFGSMANALGYETRMALLADRSEMFFAPEMTNDFFIQPGAVAVKIENQWKVFRPSDESLSYAELPWYNENVWAMLVGESNYVWFKTPLAEPEKSASKRTGKFTLTADGTLEGSVRVEFTGHSNLARKSENRSDSPARREENLKEAIKRRISTAEISVLQIENFSATNKPLAYSYKIKIPGYATRTGKRLFLQPGFFEYGTEAAFSAATRKYDVYFDYPWSENDDIEIALPEGFALESAEAPATVEDKGKIGFDNVTINLSKDQRTLVYNRQFYFGKNGKNLFPLKLYPALKSLFDAFHKADTHTLSLKQQNQ